MTKEEKLNKLSFLRNRAEQLKREADYYNALQLALKLILNGSYFLPPLFGVGGNLWSIRHTIFHPIQ